MSCCAIFQRWLTLLLYVAGLGLSGYALFVEQAKEADKDYVALCDINENVTCSKVFTSKYGKGFGLVAMITGDDNHILNQPNSIYGLIFYSLMGLLYLCGSRSRFLASLQFYAFIVANGMSCYLGYILYFVLKDMCVVCVSTYAVNFLLLLLTFCHRRRLRIKPVSPMQSSQRGPTLPSFASKDAFKKNI